MRILIVDDSRAMRMIVTRTLRQAGYGDHTIDQAADGTEALEHIRGHRPDLVLSDWNMPQMNGIELLRALRQDGVQVPFGFVTSETSADMRATAVEAGASFLIEKPFTPERFHEALAPFVAP